MIKYSISTAQAHRQVILFELRFDAKKGEELTLQLPAWRPGRYELANFAGKVLAFALHDAKGKPMPVEKKDRNSWSVMPVTDGEVCCTYGFHASELNAGSSFIDETQLYVNPVNCMFSIVGREHDPYVLSFDVPKSYKIEGMNPCRARKMRFKNADELFDSPFLASATMKLHRFKESGITFTIAIQGHAKPDWKKVESDFRPFIKAQIKAFGSCPVDRYFFLVESQDIRHYHGVEHQYGTVLALGPANELMLGKGYYNLLAVSSHEFYHTWNVKYIRPKEMMPYDFSQENYHRIGYIIEGVTTYQGDLKMWQSGVITDEEFFLEINTHLDRHMANAGRFNLSVRESSFDTWVDGYVKGTPDRKVSIYTEGALVALITDIELIVRTNGRYSLDEVMKRLYERYGKKQVGYAEEDYLTLIDEVGGKGSAKAIKKLISSAVSYDRVLKKSLAIAGLKVEEEAVSILASYFGLSVLTNPAMEIQSVHPDSEAYTAGLRAGMTVLGVEGHWLNGNVEQWLSHYKGKPAINFLIKKGTQYETVSLSPAKSMLYVQHKVKLKSKTQNKVFKRWKKAGS